MEKGKINVEFPQRLEGVVKKEEVVFLRIEARIERNSFPGVQLPYAIVNRNMGDPGIYLPVPQDYIDYRALNKGDQVVFVKYLINDIPTLDVFKKIKE